MGSVPLNGPKLNKVPLIGVQWETRVFPPIIIVLQFLISGDSYNNRVIIISSLDKNLKLLN